MNDYPEKWTKSRLGEICSKPQYGWTSKSSKDGKIKYIRTTDISSGKINWESVPFCEKEPDSVDKYRIEQNDILVSRAGSVGISYRIEEVPAEAVFASYLIRFKPIIIEPKFIEYFLKTDIYWNSISEFTAGIAVPNVNATKLAELKIPIPPLNEQHRIVEKLDKLLAKVESAKARLERIPRLLKQFRQAVLSAAVSGELTKDWRKNNPDVEDAYVLLENSIQSIKILLKGKYKEISLPEYPINEIIPSKWKYTFIQPLLNYERNGIKTGPFGSALKKSEHQQKGIPVVGIENIGEGKFNFGNKIFVTAEKAVQLNSFNVLPEEIIISRSGTVGEVCVVPFDFGPALISTNLIRMALNRTVINPYFFTYLFQGSTLILNQIRELCKGSTRDFLNQTILKSLIFVLPPLKEQNEIIKRVEALFKTADQIEARYKKAKAHVDKLQQSILAKAFRGELVAQDPNDEPAEVLLERIKSLKQMNLTR